MIDPNNIEIDDDPADELDDAPHLASQAYNQSDDDPAEDPELDDPKDDATNAPAVAAVVAESTAQEVAETEEEKPIEAAPAEPKNTSLAPGFVPRFTADMPENAAATIAALRQQELSALERLMDGDADMTAASYAAIRDRVQAGIDDIRTRSLTATMAQQFSQQVADQATQMQWDAAQSANMALFKAEGIDYRNPDKPGLLGAFNVHLKRLSEVQANADKDSTWFLQEAHRLTKSDLGLAGGTATATTALTGQQLADKVAKAKATVAARGLDKSTLPPTLAKAPAAADVSVGASEFAHLDALRGEARQRAIARLTPEQEERWLSA
jgi:hypothetical protein